MKIVSWNLNHRICQKPIPGDIVAARQSIFHGDIEPPPMDGCSIAGFLHIRFAETQMELVGLRVPAYERAAVQHEYDAQLLEIMQQVKDRPIVFAGDFNKDPFLRTKQPGALEIAYPRCGGYRVPNPIGPWSYMGAKETWTSRIDHVIHTDGVTVGSAEYVSEIDGRFLAGPKTAFPISDHAALTFTMMPTLSSQSAVLAGVAGPAV